MKLYHFLLAGVTLSMLCDAFQITPSKAPQPPIHTRRTFNKVISDALTMGIVVAVPLPALAAENYAGDDLTAIMDCAEVLTTLLEKWERATVTCIYADVPRELLEAKNKDELLEKASTFALFDKSASVVSCKRTNRIVRDYIGVTGKGPLVGVEKRMLKSKVVQMLDPDLLDDYFGAVESFSQSISKASSLSYTAGVADLDSVNNFSKDDIDITGDKSNLDQTRNAISEAKVSIDKIVNILKST